MSGVGWRVAWYRFRITFRRRWGGYVGVVVLVAGVGGLAIGSVTAGRITQSAFGSALRRSNPSDLTASAFGAGASGQQPTMAQGAGLTAKVARLPDVRRVALLVGLNALPLGRDGTPDAAVANEILPAGVLADGLYQVQDRPTVLQGRLPDPGRSDEMVVTAEAAHLLGAHVGQVIDWGFYSNEQSDQPDFGTAKVTPYLQARVRVVGVVVFPSDVVRDDEDTQITRVVFTPALTDELVGVSSVASYGLQLDHGARDVPTVEEAFRKVVPAGDTYEFHLTSRVEGNVEQALEPQSIALGVFGLIAAVAVLLIASQAVGRLLRNGQEDLDILRALGASPATLTSDGLIGALGAVLVGSLLAAGVGVALTLLAPFGPVRQLYPHRGLRFDWTVILAGVFVLVVVLGAVAVAQAYRLAPHRLARRTRQASAHRAGAAKTAAAAGLPPTAVVGVGFALEPGRPGREVPVRSALLATALAVGMVVATLTFGASLEQLVSHPALYGWNWTYAITAADKVPPSTDAALAEDPEVAGYAGYDVATVSVDGQNVPALVQTDGHDLSPPILQGAPLAGSHQVVVGAATLAKLHEHVGDWVEITYGSPAEAPIYVPPTRVQVVGTATLPAVGYASIIADHTSMGTGIIVSSGIEPAAMQRALLQRDPNANGSDLAFVRLRTGLGAAAQRAEADRIVTATNRVLARDRLLGGLSVSVLPVQRPAVIVNDRSMGATPVVLALGLAIGAVVGLGLTLVASVRRRRSDLVVLKTLGFTQRQLSATVAWQASVAAVVGVVVGVPLGVALGRQLWIQFARSIDAVPAPSVPVLVVAGVALVTLVLANLVAAIPGRLAARTPVSLVGRID